VTCPRKFYCRSLANVERSPATSPPLLSFNIGWRFIGSGCGLGGGVGMAILCIVGVALLEVVCGYWFLGVVAVEMLVRGP